jgi:hypothetical protein
VRTTRLVELTEAGRHLLVEARRTLERPRWRARWSTSNSSEPVVPECSSRRCRRAVSTFCAVTPTARLFRAQRAHDARDRRGRYPMDLARRSLP